MSTTVTYTTETQQNASLAGPVEAEINFFKGPSDGSRAYAYVEEPPAGLPKTNYGEESHRVLMNDIRGQEKNYTLDKDAFQVYTDVSSDVPLEVFDSDELVKKNYYPEVEAFILKHVPGAKRVSIFDHTIRKARPGAVRQPVVFAHVDQTAEAAKQRVRRSAENTEDAEQLLKGRYRIINVWRPLNGRVESMPLAFLTSASLSLGDLVPVERRYPYMTGETMALRFNPKQKWLYWSGVDNNERILLQCSDSNIGEQGGGRVPHSAFIDPRSPAGAKERESIEVRVLVFD